MTVRLYLVRHGETSMNKSAQLQGITDAVLTAKGRQQAEQTAKLLQGVPFSAAYSSDRSRAVTTAEIILKTHPGVSLKEFAGLREYYFGQLEGESERRLVQTSLARYGVKTMTKAWLGGERFAQLIRNFQRMDDTGQAESLPALRTRVEHSFKRIVAEQPAEADVLVVSHGVFLSALVNWLAPEQLPATLLKNASVTRLDVNGDEWRVCGVNLTTEAALAKVAGELAE
ncbi:histidine phosphatase family protein [Lacticaseibacillus sp. GG6-2]